MGGVNLSEESKNILATNSELIGSQIRSCQDKTFLPQDLVMSRVAAIGESACAGCHMAYSFFSLLLFRFVCLLLVLLLLLLPFLSSRT